MTCAEPDASPVAGFHPAVATWFERRFPDGPTAAQAGGWPLIANGRDTLIAAPTGSGKTLAGFLVAIDSLYRAHADGQDVSGATRVAYVSPLKALAVDIAHSLERPLAEIASMAVELGIEPPPITVGVRTGDTSTSERGRMLRRRPSLVVTTPESLYLLLTSTRGREALRTVETVIVDRFMPLPGTSAGPHLALSLERLEALCDRHPVLATIGVLEPHAIDRVTRRNHARPGIRRRSARPAVLDGCLAPRQPMVALVARTGRARPRASGRRSGRYPALDDHSSPVGRVPGPGWRALGGRTPCAAISSFPA